MNIFTVAILWLGLLGVGCAHRPECHISDMEKCVEPIKLMSEQDSDELELRGVCPKFFTSITCLDDYTTRCLTKKQKGLVDLLYENTRLVIYQKCSHILFEEEILEHSSCMKSYRTEQQEHCHDEEHVSDFKQSSKELEDSHELHEHVHQTHEDRNEMIRKVCCSFNMYINCTTGFFEEKCGSNAANFTARYLSFIAGPIVRTSCSDFPHDAKECTENGQKVEPTENLPLQKVSLQEFYARPRPIFSAASVPARVSVPLVLALLFIVFRASNVFFQ